MSNVIEFCNFTAISDSQYRRFHPSLSLVRLSPSIVTILQICSNMDELTYSCVRRIPNRRKNYSYGIGIEKVNSIVEILIQRMRLRIICSRILCR